MNRLFKSLVVIFIPSTLVLGCASGLGAYKKGNYYEAVLESVQNLRRSPENKKSKQALALSYQAAVSLINTDIQNQINSNAYLKWKHVIGSYQQINNLYENIRTSPAALKIITKPIDAYKELKVAKDSAAVECYNAGIQEMLKGTREDAKKAYFLFTDANNYSPGYKETIELMLQAKTNATLNVMVKASPNNNFGWNFDPVIFRSNRNQFVAFYTEQQVRDKSVQKVDQYLLVSVNGYQESRPSLSKNTQEYQENIQVGTKKDSTGKEVPIKQLVKGQATVYDKQILSSGSLQLAIEDATRSALLNNSIIQGDQNWSCRWATCGGDMRAIPSGIKNFCGKPELYPPSNFLINQTKKELDNKLSNAISEFYSSY
jgi:hypothetical protein